MCLGKGKQLAVLNVTEERLVVEKIRELPGTISAVSMDGAYVCVALESHYIIVDIRTGANQDLFPFEETPLIAKVAKVSTPHILTMAWFHGALYIYIYELPARILTPVVS